MGSLGRTFHFALMGQDGEARRNQGSEWIGWVRLRIRAAPLPVTILHQLQTLRCIRITWRGYSLAVH